MDLLARVLFNVPCFPLVIWFVQFSFSTQSSRQTNLALGFSVAISLIPGSLALQFAS